MQRKRGMCYYARSREGPGVKHGKLIVKSKKQILKI